MQTEKTKILVIVDLQNDFVSGSLANPNAEKIVEPLCEYLAQANYDRIILTRDTHTNDYLDSPEGKKLPIEHCIKETGGWCIDSRILKSLRNSYQYIDKMDFGFLYWKNLFSNFDSEFVEIDICGTVTSICVVSNALILKASFPNATIRVLSEYCADMDDEGQAAAFKVMENCQIEIV